MSPPQDKKDLTGQGKNFRYFYESGGKDVKSNKYPRTTIRKSCLFNAIDRLINLCTDYLGNIAPDGVDHKRSYRKKDTAMAPIRLPPLSREPEIS